MTFIEYKFTARKRCANGETQVSKIKALSEETIRRLHNEYFQAGWNVSVAYDPNGKPVIEWLSHDSLKRA